MSQGSGAMWNSELLILSSIASVVVDECINCVLLRFNPRRSTYREGSYPDRFFLNLLIIR